MRQPPAKVAKKRSSAAHEDGARFQLYGQFIQPLGKQPALLLIFGICVVFQFVFGGYGVATGAPGFGYAAVVSFALALVAAIAGIWIIYGNRAARETAVGDKMFVVPAQITEPAALAKAQDPSVFYDTLHRYKFDLPVGEGWSKPELLSGIDQIMAVRMTMDQRMLEQVAMALRVNPYGRMIAEAQQLRIKSGQAVELAITNETGNGWLEFVMARLRVELVNSLPEATEDEINDQLTKMKVAVLSQGIASIKFHNEFCVSWFDKSKVEGIRPRVASLLLFNTMNYWNTAQEIKMASDSIMVTTRSDFTNMMINGKRSDFTGEKVSLFTEGRDFIYQVEISYSPQTQDSFQIWSDLRRMIESFRVVE